MREGGLVEVLDASARFVGEATKAPGSRRPRGDGGLAPAPGRGPGARLPRASSCPRAGSCNGIDRNRLALVLAVLGRHARHRRWARATSSSTSSAACASTSPGADLAVALAVASAARGTATDPPPLACFGEVGLTGELRTVAHPDRRAQEAAKFGLRSVISPADAPTLRDAVQAALGVRQRRAAARPDTASRP